MPTGWLRDQFRYQTWADAQHWRMLGSLPAAREDTAVRKRLHHIHFVQHAFLWMVGDKSVAFNRTKPDDFPSFDALREYARSFHAQVPALLAGLTEERLAVPVNVIWFKDPPLTIPISEALTQCVMHSHFHRGQNATRFRELGGEPPTTDYIFWLWKGRPEPEW